MKEILSKRNKAVGLIEKPLVIQIAWCWQYTQMEQNRDQKYIYALMVS